MFLLISAKAYATDVTIPTVYGTNGTVTAANLNGNFTAIAQKVNGGLDNDNADTTNGYRFFETKSTLPSVGTQGRTIFLTSDNTLNLDTGSAYVKSVVTSTPSANQVPVYSGTAWVPTNFVNAVPTGSVIMWYGSLATIPSGFQQCDGTNGTPDLRGDLIPASATGIAPGIVSGNAYVPAHTHTTASHNHALTIKTGGGNTSLEVQGAGGTTTSTTYIAASGIQTSDSTGTATLYALAYICKN